jgi:hypothetical protein
MSATMEEFTSLVNSMTAMQIPRAKAEAAARAKLGLSGSGVDVPAIDERALEKQIEKDSDDMMLKLGFEAIKFSHPGKTMQTPGISDRRYYRRPRVIQRSDGQYVTKAWCVWVELKSSTGRQRPGQKLFQELVTACGEHYVVGGIEPLVAWLVEHRIAERVGNVLEPIADDGHSC